MGLRIIMHCTALLVPLLMILFGSIFARRAPEKINVFYGYRSRMSMKNKATWEFAHRYAGVLWRKIGLILLAASAAAMLVVLDSDANFLSIYTCILLSVQCIIMVLPIFSVEAALKKNFDDCGSPKS